MKTLSILIAFLLAGITSFAQQKNNDLVGVVADSLKQIGLPNASVHILNTTDTTHAATTTSDAQGIFRFSNLPDGKYTYTVTFVGYEKYTGNITLNHATPTPPFPVFLTAATKKLAAVTVTAAALKPFITQSLDKMTLNVAQSPLAAGGNAWDVLLRAPGVTEQNSNLNLQGKSINVLIDGRPTNLSGEDLKNYLTTLPANSIDKVEIISNPSAKYDAQGGSVINIKLLKNKNFGTNGTITAGIGTGKYLKDNAGISLNYRNKKINLYGSYDYQYNKQYYDNVSNRMVDANTSIVQDEYDIRKRNNHSYKAGLDYDINKNTSFGVLLRGSTNFRDRDVTNHSVVTTAGNNTDSSSNVYTQGYARFFNPSVNVYYKTTFDSAKELTINADYFNYNKQWNDDFTTHYYDKTGMESQQPFLLRDNSPANNTIRSITADYTQPSKIGKWEAGVKTAFTTTDNNVLWEQQAGNKWTTDSTKTNHFIYKENINAAYISFSKTIKKYSIQAGVRAEQTNTEGNSVTLNQTTKNSYLNVFPNLAVQYSKSAMQQFGLSYRRSIQRFGYDIVNPFIVYQSQYSYSQGNPYIQPMLMNSIEFSHSYKYQVFTKLGYTHISDVLAPVYKQAPSGNAIISSYDNLNSADVYSGSVTWMKSLLKGKWISVNTGGAFYAKYNAASQANAKVTGFFSTNNTFSLPHQVKAELSGSYYSPIASGVYLIHPMYSVNGGLSVPVMKSKGSLAFNVTDIFNTQVMKIDVTQGVNIHYNNKAESRFVNLVFTYKFGNNKVKASKTRKTGIEDEKGRMSTN